VTFGGDVRRGYGFTSIGQVDFSGATIKGAADFSGGSFTNKEGNRLAINADSAIFEKYILFGSGFKIGRLRVATRHTDYRGLGRSGCEPLQSK